MAARTRFPGAVSTRSLATVVACCLTLACRTDRITTEGVEVAFASDAWSGGMLALHSAAFTGADSLPTVTTGAETLTVRSLGTDSVLVQMPDTNGSVALSIHLRAFDKPLGSVRVHGFRSAGFGPRVEGAPYPWPGSGAPRALAFQDGRLVLLDYRYGTASPLTADTALGSPCLAGPVPSATEPGLVVVSSHSALGVCGPMVAVPVTPGAAGPDTGPPPPVYFAAMQLGRGRWLINRKYWFDLRVRTPSGGFTTVVADIPGDEASTFAISPRGDRVVPVQCGSDQSPAGPPVFEPDLPSVAYTLPALSNLGGAAFSAGGDTLYVSGLDSLASSGLFLSLDASSGRILGRAKLGSAPAGQYTSSSSVAVDANRPWVYVADERDGRPYIIVFDGASLARAATLRVPTQAIQLGQGDLRLTYGIYVLVTSPGERRLYLTVNNQTASGPGPSVATYVLAFDLMP
jgi:hypothetical protein